MRLIVVAQHGESELNEQRRVNGDPNVPVQLSERGREEARLLGEQLANLPLEACIHTRFARTRETANIALLGRDMPFVEEPLLDDIDVGELEGCSIDDYRTWKAGSQSRRSVPRGREFERSGAALCRGVRGTPG